MIVSSSDQYLISQILSDCTIWKHDLTMDGVMVYTTKTLVTIHPSRVECVTAILVVGVAVAGEVASVDCVGGGTCC